MKKVILLLVCTFIFSCTKNDDSSYGGARATVAHFTLKNSQGVDLLDPSNPNSFKENDIRIYFLIDGTEKLMYNTDLDNPDYITISKKGDSYTIEVLMNEGFTSSNAATTYIQWSPTERDEVKAEYLKGQGSILKRKVWLNNQLVWEYMSSGRDYNAITPIVK